MWQRLGASKCCVDQVSQRLEFVPLQHPVDIALSFVRMSGRRQLASELQPIAAGKRLDGIDFGFAGEIARLLDDCLHASRWLVVQDVVSTDDRAD